MPLTPIHTLLTKCDKLTRQESINALRTTQKGLDAYRDAGVEGKLTVQLFSALKRTGLDEAHALIESWVRPSAADANGEVVAQ